MDFFKKTPTAKVRPLRTICQIHSFDTSIIVSHFQEQVRANDRQLRKVGREIDRDRAALEREEKKLEMEIKKAAKTGNKVRTKNRLSWFYL